VLPWQDRGLNVGLSNLEGSNGIGATGALVRARNFNDT